MILDVEIVLMGDSVYAAKLRHERLGLLKSIVESKSLTDAKNKINNNFKQAMWKAGLGDKHCPITFHFTAINLDKSQIGYADTPKELRQFHPDVINDARDKEDPKIWSLEEVIDDSGKPLYRAVKHDRPLMSKKEVQIELMAKMFK